RFFCFQAEDGIRDLIVTGVQTCALPISRAPSIALIDASSASATTRGVASTSTSPEWNAHAVSASVTCMLTVADRPGRGAMDAQRSEERRGGKECWRGRTGVHSK